jgi:hypothetical protein
MKDWHQRFLEDVQRNLHNWWKCVGTKIPINVLYPLSFSIFNLTLILFKLCLCFDLWNSNSHLHTYWREVKWVSLSVFCFWLLCSLIWNTHQTHKLKELWNDLWNAPMLNRSVQFIQFLREEKGSLIFIYQPCNGFECFRFLLHSRVASTTRWERNNRISDNSISCSNPL